MFGGRYRERAAHRRPDTEWAGTDVLRIQAYREPGSRALHMGTEIMLAVNCPGGWGCCTKSQFLSNPISPWMWDRPAFDATVSPGKERAPGGARGPNLTSHYKTLTTPRLS